MKKVLLLSIIAACALIACKKDVDELLVERPFTRDFYIQGEWRDTLPSTFLPFDYTIGERVKEPLGNQYTCKSKTSLANNRKRIQGNLYGTSNTNELFFIRFSKPDTDSIWTASELKELFTPERVFPITGTPGEVEIGFEIPWVVNSYWVSESWNAPNPNGSVKIIAAEDYEWEALNGLGNLVLHKGLKVKLQFQANLGRLGYTMLQLQVVGEAEIKNGEASLFFEY